MLELNKWFFVQLANFLLLLVVLNIILFRPMLRLFQEREEHTTGFLNDAKAMDKEKDEVFSKIDSKLADARDRAKAIFEEFSTEGIETQKLAVDSAKNEAIEINRKSKEEIEMATDKARAALRADIENFSNKIVEKLVGK